MSIERILQLKLVADVGKINTALTGVAAQTSRVSSAFNTLTSFAGPIAINAALTGVTMLVDGLKGGVEDAKKFNDAVTGLAATVEPLGLAAADARALADSAAAAGSALGFADDDQVVRGLQAFAEQTQSVTEAQALLAAAMDLSRLKGIGLEEATAKVQAIYKGSSRTLAEFGVTGVVGMTAVTAALGDNASAAETWATSSEGQYATVAAAIDDAFQTAGSAVNDAINGVVLPALSELLPKLGELWATWQPVLAELGTKFGEVIGKMLEVWNKLQPAIRSFFEFVQPVFEGIAIAVETAFGVVTGVLDAVIALLNGDVTAAFGAIQGVVDTMVSGIQQGIANMVGFFGDIAGTVLSAAGNVGKAIFDGIIGALRGLGNAIVEPIRDGINGIIRGWNDFRIPEVVLFDGFGRRDTIGPIEFPNIPLLAKGGIVTGPTLAMIGEAGAEAVVPLDRMGGMGATYHINVNVAPGGDLVQTGRLIVEAIQQYERRSGRVWRAA